MGGSERWRVRVQLLLSESRSFLPVELVAALVEVLLMSSTADLQVVGSESVVSQH